MVVDLIQRVRGTRFLTFLAMLTGTLTAVFAGPLTNMFAGTLSAGCGDVARVFAAVRRESGSVMFFDGLGFSSTSAQGDGQHDGENGKPGRWTLMFLS
jgi:hypothetical protein